MKAVCVNNGELNGFSSKKFLHIGQIYEVRENLRDSTMYDIIDDNKFTSLSKLRFLTLKEQRKQKLGKLNKI